LDSANYLESERKSAEPFRRCSLLNGKIISRFKVIEGPMKPPRKDELTLFVYQEFKVIDTDRSET